MKMLSLKKVSEEYGISISMLRKLIKQKEISVVKVGAKNFIQETEMNAYIERRMIKRSKNV